METASNFISFENTENAFSGRSNRELKRAYWLFKLFNNNILVSVGKKMMLLAIRLNLPVSLITKKTVFRQFCGGETLRETMNTVNQLAKYNIKSDLAYSVEGKNDENDFVKSVDETIQLIQNTKNNPDVVFISVKITGFARISLLEKIHANLPLSEKEKKEFAKVSERVDKICQLAAACGKIIFIDAEESWIQQPLDDFANLMMKKYNQKKAVIYNTFQLYRCDQLSFLKKSLEQAEKDGYILGVKIVRGAYMEKERLRAKKYNYPSPIHPDKPSTDRDFNAAIDFCISHLNKIALCVASHNQESCLHLVNLIEKNKITVNHPHIFFGQLFGMSDNISYNLAKAGFNVAKYIPYGPLKEVIPYLIRRAEENTSIAGQMGRELQLIKKEMVRRKVD